MGGREGVVRRFRSGWRCQVRGHPGDVKQGRVLIVMRAPDDRSGRSFVVAGEIVEDIEVKSGIAALGLEFIQRQLREGKGNDHTLNGRHTDESQALHGAECFNSDANEIGGVIFAFADAIAHPTECDGDSIPNKEEIHGGILYGSGGLISHVQPRPIDIKPADFEMQTGLGWKRERQIRQGLIDGSRQQELLDGRARRAGNFLLDGAAGKQEEQGDGPASYEIQGRNGSLPSEVG